MSTTRVEFKDQDVGFSSDVVNVPSSIPMDPLSRQLGTVPGSKDTIANSVFTIQTNPIVYWIRYRNFSIDYTSFEFR